MRPGFHFSHVGLYVTDLARMRDFYERLLGFTVTDTGQLSGPSGPMELVFLSRDPDEHHQIVLVTGRPADAGFNPINQISFRTGDLATLRAMHQTLLREGFGGVTPVTHGNAVSVYVPDPEGNRVELFVDLPWYVVQPMREPVDLSLDDATLMTRLEAQARSLPGFKPRAEWRAEMARRMGLA